MLQKEQQNQQQQRLSPLVCTQEKKLSVISKFEDTQLLSNFETNSLLSNNILINEKKNNETTANKILENIELTTVNKNINNSNNNLLTYPVFNNIVDTNSIVNDELQKQNVAEQTVTCEPTSTNETLIPEFCLSYNQVNKNNFF